MKKSNKLITILLFLILAVLGAVSLAACDKNEPVSYTITYNLKGGTNNPDNPESYTEESSQITLKDPTREGYYFLCWEEGDSIPKGSTGDKIFTAVWSEFMPTAGLFFTELSEDGYSVSKGVAFTDDIIVIPSWYNSMPVKEIDAGGFSNYEEMSGIIIPDTITKIGENAFNNCGGLLSVEIPSGVTYIGTGAFSGCDNLESVTVGGGAVSENAFKNCYNLTTLILKTGVTYIGTGAFLGCSGLTEISIPVGVTEIGENAFVNCTGLEIINIPSGLASIGKYAFFNCNSLLSITLPSGVEKIGSNAFSECRRLTIYSEAESALSGWHNNWNDSYRPVVRGCILSNNKNYVVTFVKTGGNIENPSAAGGISAPYREGYVFVEWNTSAAGTGNRYLAGEINNIVYSVPLYAIWEKSV